jgi:glycosidase
MPIHPAGQKNRKGPLGSPYAVQDYYAINSSFGTKDDFKRLVSEAHQHGMKVIIDIVANHTSWDSVLLKSHPEWFKHDAQGHVIPPNPDWSDVAGLDYSHPELRAYMIEMLKYWLRNFDLDGFRCDVAGEVPTDFWESARLELEKINPKLVMLAESEKPELLNKAFDLDYSWALMHTLNDVIEDGMPASAIQQTVEQQRAKYPQGAMQMRISDDHDEARAIVRYGERAALAASAFVFTTDGVPLLYNGMEVSDTTESTAPALFYDLKVFWPISEKRPRFPEFYKQLLALRHAHPALQQGETQWLHNSGEDRVLTYLRRNGNEQYVIAINFSNQPFDGTVQATAGTYIDDTPALAQDAVPETLPALKLKAWEFRIMRLTN